MFNIDEWQSALTPFLKAIDADQAEVIASAKAIGATRFANNAISQNQDEDTLSLRLRVIKDGRQGVASGNSLEPDALKAMAARALNAAALDQANPDLLPMISEQPKYQSVNSFDADTAEASATQRADIVGAQIAKVKAAGFEAAGLLKSGATACAMFNSNGVQAAYQRSLASITMSAFADEGQTEALQDGSSMTLAGLDAERVGNDVVERCRRARGAKPIAAGAYDVVLEEAALSDLMLFLSWLGFNSLAHSEGRSGLAGKLGEQVFHKDFSLWSDPYHEAQQGCPFDMEGFPTQGLHLVDQGVVKQLPHDRRTASKMGEANTGHGNQQPD
ncbi:MAG: hypothetical protein KDB07_08610, partial [Planctomycetes bacterium]|nr:hypothetical protein [Planctomycetota bacterium]